MSEENTQNLNDSRSFEERVFARFDAMDNRFTAIDARFDAVDRRFEAIDARFDAVDRRFEQVDARFDAVDRRFEAIDARFDAVDRRFEQVDARFDKVDSSIQDLNARVERLEVRSYDTKPIWEQALKEILETKLEVIETRRELSKRLDRIGAVALENRADLREAEERIEKLESKLSQ